MGITTNEYLRLLAEFNNKYRVTGFFGKVEIHFVDGKANGYYANQFFKPKDLEGLGRVKKKY